MTTQDLGLMSALLQKMDWTEHRQQVLSQNIANADTPGYKPQDIAPFDFKGLLNHSTSTLSLSSAGGGSTGLATTNPMHLTAGGSTASGDGTPAKNSKHNYETAPAGNSVVIEEQLLKMNANFADHSFASNLYMRNMQMLKTSIKSS